MTTMAAATAPNLVEQLQPNICSQVFNALNTPSSIFIVDHMSYNKPIGRFSIVSFSKNFSLVCVHLAEQPLKSLLGRQLVDAPWELLRGIRSLLHVCTGCPDTVRLTWQGKEKQLFYTPVYGVPPCPAWCRVFHL